MIVTRTVLLPAVLSGVESLQVMWRSRWQTAKTRPRQTGSVQSIGKPQTHCTRATAQEVVLVEREARGSQKQALQAHAWLTVRVGSITVQQTPAHTPPLDNLQS